MVHGIDLQQLRYAVAADDCRSFRRAADLLSVRHSVLSRSINQFEHIVGVPLFRRSTSGVTPTAAGLNILDRSRTILEHVDALVAAGQSIARGHAGRLAVGFCTSISAGNLRASLIEFRKRAPSVELAVVELSPLQLRNAIHSGTIDLAVVPEQSTPADLEGLPVWSERFLLVLPGDHPLASRKLVHWSDLRNETLLLSQRDPDADLELRLVSGLLADHECPRIERHNVSRGLVKSLVSMGLGFSVGMESDLGATFAGVVYRELEGEIGHARIQFYAQWRADNKSPVLKRYVELLTERHRSVSSPGG
ncbi:LysR family transcriptional regulator [Bradyrhizobium sp. 149]|uniref:LysR substrate-binding domain-containing protein n=1 Tax=Bradyrhizobium sp. 149 TaxID=2782624 RepID=UPI001FFA1EAF|nr:LysR family transcriptional regulator [Bradyrhizobium sp. 149]MCK1655342.1 LysR family transcriptional regulator [Bradyrhizobium sp. 149]